MNGMWRVTVLLVVSAAVVGVAGAALYAQEGPTGPATGQAGSTTLRDLDGDVAVLSLLKRIGFTADQAKTAAGIVGDYASKATEGEGAIQAKLADSEALLRSMRESLLLGSDPDAQTAATYAVLQRDLARARVEVVRARAEATRALQALLTPAQIEALQARGPGAQVQQRLGGNAPGQLLKVIRQWSDEDYAQKKTDIVKRIVGPDAPAEKSEKAAALLDKTRALPAEEFEAQQQALLAEFGELSAGQRLGAGPPGGLGGRGANGAGLGKPPGGGNGDPFGAPPGRGGGLLNGNGPGAGGERPGARGAGVLVGVRKLPEDKYQAERPKLIDKIIERSGIPPTDANKEQVGELLDQIRGLSDEELRTKLPEIGKQFAELTGAANGAGPKAGGPGVGAGAEGKPVARLGLERLLGTDAAQARHAAEMLGQFAQNLAKGQ